MSNDVGAASPQKSDQKPSLTKALPSSRMSFSKQLDLIRAYGILGGNGDAVKLADAADMVKAHPSNVSTMNPFMLENGIVTKSAGSGYLPEAAVIEFGKAHAWNPETAPHKLAPLLKSSWFGQLLLRRTAFGALSEEKAIEALALECSAGPEYKAQIRMLIEYADTAGLIRRDNGQLTPVRADVTTSSPALEKPVAPVEVGSAPRETSATGFIGADGAVSLNVSIQVNLAELKGWPADRITAFFSGIAQVVAAREKSPK